MNSSAISVQNVSKTFKIPHEKITSLRGAAVNVFKKNSYEEFKALDNVSFEVKKGEFFGIIGRNGSGKSTLLKIIAGIYEADKGKIHVNGMISPFLELGIGFNPELSGRDNVYLNATVLGMTKKQIDKKFDDIVAFSELERFIDQKLKNYSSGMSVRLAFSVSIHANREILLMDEVLAVGDTNFQSKCLQEFNKYKDAGKTVILVTHDIATVQKYCDRALLLRNGKIVMIGNSEEVGDKYVNQNILDEEGRISNEGKNKKSTVPIEGEGDKPQKVAEITKVEFLDKEGKEKNVFETGEDMSARVYFKKNKQAKLLNFAISIHNQENICIIGVDTIIDKIKTEEIIQAGYFKVNFKNIPLKADSYFVNVAIYGGNDKGTFDRIIRARYFKVFSRDKNYGMISMDYDWNQNN